MQFKKYRLSVIVIVIVIVIVNQKTKRTKQDSALNFEINSIKAKKSLSLNGKSESTQ